ncbi:MAG TPA: hypothetical protein VGH14_12870 [Solirubrobacterales bacterium]
MTRRGGRIVMGNWIPGDPTLVDRFGEAGIAAEQVAFERASWIFEHAGTPEELVGLFRDYYGPTMNAFAAAAADGRDAQLQAELDAL